MMLMTEVILAFVLAGSTGSPRDVVARVDALAISRGDVTGRLELLRARGRPTAPLAVVNDLVDEAVLATEARRLGLDRDRKVAEDVDRMRRRLLVEALGADLAKGATLTDEALRQMYHASGDSVRLVVVKLATEAEAAAALARVKGGADLAAEAKRALDPKLARTGGDTGVVTRMQLDPALADEAFRAAVGSLVGPVRLKNGWAIARVVERTVSDEAGFPARREALATFARKQLVDQARRHLAGKLRARSAATIDEAFLASLGTRVDATPEELDRVIATVNGKAIRYREVQPRIAEATGGGGHLAGPAVKIAFAGAVLDELLLAEAALERGIDAWPTVKDSLPAYERTILASALATSIGRGPGPGTPDDRIRARIGELRAHAKVQLDERMLASLSAATHP